jgi:pantoate--beta-alanine ligase
MILFKKAGDMYQYIVEKKKSDLSVGYVPTMGALHQGHISLIVSAKQHNDITVCSIFVNPTQFNNKADFEKYPITIERDIDMLEQTGCEVLFLPPVNEIYPNGLNSLKHYNLGYLETILEGKYRPGHFQGVCQVVYRLLEIVQPHHLYLGQKDFQQCMVIKKMIELAGLQIHINICNTLRETDGLALSSRNMRLNENERKLAVKISETLYSIKTALRPGYVADLTDKALNNLATAGFKTDYVSLADASTLEPVDEWDGKQKIVALIAAYLNDIRLIDNMLLS